MPDGKRNSLASEGETDGVDCFYDDELQNSSGIRRKLPLNHNSRGFNNLSDRLLKTMVANEIKKSLDGADNKKLVAHHRPVLHSESEASGESEMVVFGVALSRKQIQNEEVSKAIDMLQRNGVNCVCFTLKDSLQNGERKDDNTVQPCENGNSSSTTAELLKNLVVQKAIENPTSLEQNELSPAEKKVSSPTVSTTSDYTSPTPKDASTDGDVVKSLEPHDTCTSTTSPVLAETATIVRTEMETSSPVAPLKRKKALQRRNTKKAQLVADTLALTSLLPDSPPSTMDSQSQQTIEEGEGDGSIETTEVDSSIAKEKPDVDSTAVRRKKRRKRMYPYLSRRKSRSKRKKVSLPNTETVEALKESTPSQIKPPLVQAQSIPEIVPDAPIIAATKPSLTKEIDPYEFEDSDIDSCANDTFKTPSGRGVPTNGISSRKRASKSMTSSSGSGKNSPRKKSPKRSPRKRLTFPKSRAFSPDITDHKNSAAIRLFEDKRQQVVVEPFDNKEEKLTPLESCVQPISTAIVKNTTEALPTSNITPYDKKLVLPLQIDENHHSSPSPLCDESPRIDVPIASDVNGSSGSNTDKQAQATTGATPKTFVQTKNISQVKQVETKQPASEFLVPAPPDDSLHDAPDSMQLRRSSFYSSISRNVRTNLEKYLDGRPPDLKPAKRSKKIKNGFLLHHGDNFPDDPEAPYRLHLATQVLLKLNKRRVKCKPKEDKGKSLLSYLKLQPKRVSRVGKNSKVSLEDSEQSSSKEPTSVFSGEWTVPRKYVCNICGQVENAYWDMVLHKGEVHPGIVVTHVELNDDPPEGFRRPPSPRVTTSMLIPPPCTKCGSTFTNYSDLHRHIFECAGNASVLDEVTSPKVAARKKKSKRKRGFKRRISGLPKKNANANKGNSTVSKSGEITKRRNSEVFKCEFCTREFKTEGWLKNHVSLSHSLPVSIPLNKLSLPTRASISSSRRFTAQVTKPTKQLCRES